MESPLAALLWRSLRVYQVFGANTEVGKTVFTTLLCKSAKRNWKEENVSFLKPVSTGPLNEADDQCKSAHNQRRADLIANASIEAVQLRTSTSKLICANQI